MNEYAKRVREYVLANPGPFTSTAVYTELGFTTTEEISQACYGFQSLKYDGVLKGGRLQGSYVKTGKGLSRYRKCTKWDALEVLEMLRKQYGEGGILKKPILHVAAEMADKTGARISRELVRDCMDRLNIKTPRDLQAEAKDDPPSKPEKAQLELFENKPSPEQPKPEDSPGDLEKDIRTLFNRLAFVEEQYGRVNQVDVRLESLEKRFETFLSNTTSSISNIWRCLESLKARLKNGGH